MSRADRVAARRSGIPRHWSVGRRLRGKGPLVAVGAVLLASSLVAFSRIPLLPDIAADLRLGATGISAITACFALGRLATDLPAGRLADRVPARVVLAAVGVLLATGSVVLATAPSLAQVLVGILLVGVATALVNVVGMVQFSVRSAPSTRGQSMAAFSVLLLGGQVFGPLFGGTLSDAAGWRAAQVGCAAIGVCVVVGCLLPATNRQLPTGPAQVDGGPLGAEPFGWTERAILAASRFVVFFAVGALPQTFVPLIGADGLGLSATAIGVALSIGGISRFFGASAVGYVSDHVSRKAALVPGLAVMGGGAALLAAPPSVPLWAASIVLLAVGSAGISAAAAMVGDRATAGRLGAELSGFRFVGDIGMLVGPIVTGLTYQWAGRQTAMLLVAGLLLACACLALVALRDSYTAVGVRNRA